MNHIKAICYMLLFCLCLPLGDALVRVLHTNGMPITQIIFIRSVVIISILFPILFRQKAIKIPRKFWKIYCIRSFFFFMAVICWLSVLSKLELPQMYSVGFTAPILASIISVLVLNEQITKRKIIGLIGGFIGTLIVIRPGLGGLNLYLLVPLFCAFNWAGAMVVSKQLSTKEPPIRLTFYLSASFIVLTSGLAIPQWVTPQGMEWGILLFLGILVLTSHVSLLKAYQTADLTLLAPFEFSSLIFATSFGWLFFKEGIDMFTIIGAFVIFTSATYATLKPRKKIITQSLKLSPE